MSSKKPSIFEILCFYHLAREFDNGDILSSTGVLLSKLGKMFKSEKTLLFKVRDDLSCTPVNFEKDNYTHIDQIVCDALQEIDLNKDFEAIISDDQVKRIMGIRIQDYLVVSVNGKKAKKCQKKLKIIKNVLSSILSNAEPARTKFIDDMTGLKNRNSYDTTCKSFEAEPEKMMTIVSIDLFRLKDINDNYSHSKGDEYIEGVANILKNNFEGFADIYRIGGDEFVLLIDGNDEKIISDTIDRVGAACYATSTLDIGINEPLRMNYGFAYGSSHNIEENRKVADKALMVNKDNMYYALGIDKRRTRLKALTIQTKLIKQ